MKNKGFALSDYNNIKFFNRLNGEPDFSGKKVLDIGCGYGSLCVYIACKGAKKVIGVDIDDKRITSAKENLFKSFPDYKDVVTFYNTSIEDLEEYDFDIIVSKNTFEHIIHLDKVMPEIIKRIKINGYLLVGFGPLYNSFNGDHGRTKSKIPWGHLLRSEKSIVKSINKKRKDKISSIFDLGLNKYSFKEYELLFERCGLNILYWGVNVNTRLVSRIFTQIARIGFLKEYFLHNIYVVLKKEIKA
jgi:SAM-dependent methyltransferase